MLEVIKNLVWSPATVISLILLGIILLIKTHFFTVIGLKSIFRDTVLSVSKNRKAFGLMCTSLGGTIGVGNAIGVAGAICEGGAGAVFWMAVAGIFGMAIKYTEVYLSMCHGGSIEYIEYSSGSRLVATFFSILCIFVSLGMGNAAQARAAINSVDEGSQAIRIITAIILSVAFLYVVMGGIDKIRFFSEITVPAVSLIYTVILVIIILLRKDLLSNIFQDILNEAGILTGIKWSLIKSGITSGFSKSIFSSEAGLGSAGFTHSESDASPSHQAKWAVVEVFADSFICMMTALALLTYSNEISSFPPFIMTKGVFVFCFGNTGRIIYGVSMVTFAFASLVCWYYNGSRAVIYLTKRKSVSLFYLVVFTFLIFMSAFLGDSVILELSDIANGLMLTVNLCALWNVVIKKKLTF